MTGPAACPSLGPTAPGGGGVWGRPWPALSRHAPDAGAPPAPPRSPTRVRALSPPAALSFGPGSARSRRGGWGSSWPGVGPPAGTSDPLGIPCLLPFGRRPESAGWAGLAAAAPKCATRRPGSRGMGQHLPDPATVGGGLHPVPSASFLILTLS